MGELHARLLRHQFHGDGVGRGRADRGIGELARIGLGELDHVLPLLEWTVGLDRGAQRVAPEVDDVGEVRHRIERRLLHVGDAEHRDGDLTDGIAVGLGVVSHIGRPERGAATRLVVDHHRLPEVLGSAVGDAPEQKIGCHTSLERHDERDRF